MATAHRPAGEHENIEARRERVFKLRLAGASMRQIATQENVNATTVKKDLDVVLGRLRKETDQTAATVRDLELARLDKLLVAVWGDATNPNAKGRNFSIDRALGIMERRAKLLGLDAPISIKAEHIMPPELVALLEALQLPLAQVYEAMFKYAQTIKAERERLTIDVKS